MAADCGLPVALAPYAERLFERFPEVLEALGHPSLPEEFLLPPPSTLCDSAICDSAMGGASVSIQDECGKRRIKVVLPRWRACAHLDRPLQSTEDAWHIPTFGGQPDAALAMGWLEQQRVEQQQQTNQLVDDSQPSKHSLAKLRELSKQLVREQRSIEQRFSDQCLVDQQIIDQWVWQQHTERSLVEHEHAEQQLRIRQVLEQRLAQQQSEEQRVIEQHFTEQLVAEQRFTEQRFAEEQQRLTKQRLAEQRLTKQRLAEQRLVEQQLAEQQLAEQRLAEQRLAEQRLAEQRLAEQRLKEQRAREHKLAEQQVAEERFTLQRLAEQRLAQQRLEAQRLSKPQLAEQQLVEQQVAKQLELQPAKQHLLKGERLTEQQLEEHWLKEQARTEKQLVERRLAEQRSRDQRDVQGSLAQQRLTEQLVRLAEEDRLAEQSGLSERTEPKVDLMARRGVNLSRLSRQTKPQADPVELELEKSRVDGNSDVSDASKTEVRALLEETGDGIDGRKSRCGIDGLTSLKERRGINLTMPVASSSRSPNFRNKERPTFLATRGYNSPQFKQLAVQDLTRKRQRNRRGSNVLNSMIERPLPPAFPLRRTVTIFDWDDTLCPTSWIRCILKDHLADSKQWQTDGNDWTISAKGTVVEGRVGARMLGWNDERPTWFAHSLPDEPEFQQAMRDCEERAIDALNAAQMFGAVCIVTNALPGWVDATVKKWLPRLRPYISGHGVIRPIRVFYSQREYLPSSKNLPWVDELGKHMAWKKAAMTTVMSHIDELYAAVDGNDLPADTSSTSWIAGDEARHLTNLICIGDDECEMVAGELAAVERSVRRARGPLYEKRDLRLKRRLSTVADNLREGRLYMAAVLAPRIQEVRVQESKSLSAGQKFSACGRTLQADAKAAALSPHRRKAGGSDDTSSSSSGSALTDGNTDDSGSSSSALTDADDSDDNKDDNKESPPSPRRNQAPRTTMSMYSGLPPVLPATRCRQRTALSEPPGRSRFPDTPWVKLVKLRSKPDIQQFTEQLSEVAKLLPHLSALRRHLRVEFETDYSGLDHMPMHHTPISPKDKDASVIGKRGVDDVSAERMWYLREPDACIRDGVWNAEDARIGRLLQTQMV